MMKASKPQHVNKFVLSRLMFYVSDIVLMELRSATSVVVQ